MNAHNEEKIAGTNLTTISEYSATAVALVELKHRFQNVVHDVTTRKGMDVAKKDRAELRTLRTGLEKMRKEIKAPALERCRQIDSEAARLTSEISALEDPIDAQIKAEEGRVEAERIAAAQAEQARIDKHREAIQRLRDFPLSLQGKPSAIICARIVDFQASFEALPTEQWDEFAQEASDAFRGAMFTASAVLTTAQAHEAEQQRLAELEAQAEKDRQEREALQAKLREAEEREAARQREEERREQERIAAEQRAKEEAERAERQRQEAEARAVREAQERAEREARESELAAERERQQLEQVRLDAEAERQRQEAAKIEQERLQSLDLMEAVKAVVEYFKDRGPSPHCINDLIAVWKRGHHE